MRLIAGFIAVMAASSVFAYEGFGVCNFGKEAVNTVVCNGPTVMKQTTVNGDINVTGSLQAENISARKLTIIGSVSLKNSLISNAVNVTGDFSADHVEFKKGIAIVGNKISLSHVKVNGMVTVTSADKSPYLQVQCGTVVTGSVLFDGKAGVIQVTGDSLVQGKVVNGALEFVKRDCDG